VADLLPRNLTLVSQYPLALDAQRYLAQQYITAATAVLDFAKTEELELQRVRMPERVVLCASPKTLAAFTGMPEAQYGGQVVARVDLRWGTVYLGRRDPSDLYVELGKWFFYEETMRWGENRVEDLRRLGIAERFALVCQQTGMQVSKR
jgi:hypothetical protein